MSDLEQEVVSIWGRISRRELLHRFATSGLAVAVGGLDAVRGQRAARQTDTIRKPYNDLVGLPFREFEPPRGAVADLFKKTPAKGGGKRPPKPRKRDAFWYSKPNSALGINIFQYTQSRSYLSNSCAQAALATLIHKYNLIPDGLSGDAVTDRIYQTHPPDQTAGTTIPVLVRAIEAYGLNSWHGYGAEHGEYTIRATLRQWVAAGYPCVVLLDMRPPTGRLGQGFFGHYVTVFAYDEDETSGYVYMSNWDYKSWQNSWPVFKRAWSLSDYPARAYPLIIGWK